ncbi:hypothetical protein [Neobacillus cucumis]|uniref:hypothetical protein n=1 Tax=Neobacillus cucumis TaxID=1740721 RepID=UPI00196314B5|nr:hypothetical protein [Neobacillus cucumis]MBM7653443.1 peptidase E [Neobacillus cucumis]MED4228257.1 hypothetical protein [Neobacillus cucumis]
MDKHLQQTFDIRFLKIGNMVNAGVLQIGCGSGQVHRAPNIAYTTVGSSLLGLSAPQQFAVPLSAGIRQ